jgi:hypothetical protein
LNRLLINKTYPQKINIKIFNFLVILAVTGTTVLAQAFYPDDPIAVFYPNYIKNEYRLVYLLKDNIAVTIERVEESNSREDLLKIEAHGDGFVKIITEPASEHIFDVKGQKIAIDKSSETKYSEEFSGKINNLINGKDGKRVITINSKDSWSTKIYHKMNNGDSIQTCIMALEKPRDYEKGITILTDESQAPLIIKPASGYTIYVKTDKKANETAIDKAKSEFLDPVEAIELTKIRQEARTKADLSSQENLANNNNAIVIKNSADDPKNDPHLAELLKNAEAGDAKAQYNLGLAFYNGVKGPPAEVRPGIRRSKIILTQNTSLATDWFRKSAAQGYSEAQFMLGKCYLAGNGVEKNKEEAMKWLKVATDQGNKEAEAELSKHENHPQSATNPQQNP